MIKQFLKDESGATAIEYTILVSMLALAGLTCVDVVHDKAIDQFAELNAQMNSGVIVIEENF